MSSAILYVAIVVIWAGVLVPRWLRLRSTPARQPQPVPAQDPPADAAPADPAGPPGTAAPRTYPQPDAPQAEAPPPGRPQPGALRSAGVPRPAAARPAKHAERRARVLRARRRMLAALVLLTAGAAGAALIHLAPRWVTIPPTLLLAGFFVLLREAAQTDAKRAQRHALAARPGSRAVAGHQASTPAAGIAGVAGGAGAAEVAEATAQVIDISGRIQDQLYDQYTDAAERAVGD